MYFSRYLFPFFLVLFPAYSIRFQALIRHGFVET